MIDEHHEEQNPSSSSLPKCSAALTVETEADKNSKNDSSVTKRPRNVSDQSLVESDASEVRDIVETIENVVFRIVDDNFDRLANHSSNTLGMLVKDSLILKVKQSDKKEVPFDGLKTSLACGSIIDDDLQIGFLPRIESLAPCSYSENLSTKRKKSVCLAEEVKVFEGIENEFFAENEAGFCNELIDNRSDKIMDRGKSDTGREDKTNDLTTEKITTPEGSQGSKSSFLNSPNTVVSHYEESEIEITKELENSTEDPMFLSYGQLISNDDEASQEIRVTDDHCVRSGVLDAQNWTIASAPEEDQSLVSLVETEARQSSLRKNPSLVLGDDDSTVDESIIELLKDDEVAINESRQNSYAIDNLDTDEVYWRKKSPDADETLSETVNEEKGKIKQIRKLTNEFLSSLKKPNEHKRQDKDQTTMDIRSTQSSEDTKEEYAMATITVLEMNKTLEDKISEKRIQSLSHSGEELLGDDEIQDSDSHMNQKAKEVTNSVENVNLRDDNPTVEKSPSQGESFVINDQLLADVRVSDTLVSSETDVKDVTETSDESETKKVEGNNGIRFPNNERLDELNLSVKEISDTKSTFDTIMESSRSNPLSEETWTKVSPKADNLSKHSSGTDNGADHRSTNDLSSKQTSSTVSQGGSKSSKKSSNDTNNLTVETFPVFPEDKDVLKRTSYLHVKELHLTTITLNAGKSPANLEDDKYKESGGIGLEDSTGASGVIEVLRTNSYEEKPLKELKEDIKSEKKDPVDGEEAFPRESRSVESQRTLQLNHSPGLFITEPAVVAYFATPSAVEYQMEHQRRKGGSSDSNLKSIFKSLNESQSEKLDVDSIEDIENTHTVKKLSEIEVEAVEIQPIRSTKSLQGDRKLIQDKRTTGHKLLDDLIRIETVVQQPCPAERYNFTKNENQDKPEDFAVANDEANCSEEIIVKSIPQKLSTHDDIKVDGNTVQKMKIKNLRKSDENAKKFARSLSRIFSNSSSRKNGGKESRATLASRSSVKDHSEVQKIPVSSYQSCEIETQKSEVTDNNGEELVGDKSLDSTHDSFTAYKESIVESSSKYSAEELEDVKVIRKSVEKICATKGTIASYPLMVENAKYESAEDCNDDGQPVEKSQRKSSRKSFAGIRKLFSGASTRNKKDHLATEDLHLDHQENEDFITSGKISSFTSVNDNEGSVDDTKKSSLLSMAKSYIKGRGAVKRCTESSQDSMTLSTEDQKKILKGQGSAKTQSVFSRGMRRLFKKRNDVVDSVASTNDNARDSAADDLEQSLDVENFSQPRRYDTDDLMLGSKSCDKTKEKSDIEQSVCSTTTEPSILKDHGRNVLNDKTTVPLLGGIGKKSDEWPNGRSKSHNRSTVSDHADDDDVETYSNFKLPERHTAEIRFMGLDKPEKKTDTTDSRPMPSFAGRRSTIVMMATPMAPGEEAHDQHEESSTSNQARDESSR